MTKLLKQGILWMFFFLSLFVMWCSTTTTDTTEDMDMDMTGTIETSDTTDSDDTTDVETQGAETTMMDHGDDTGKVTLWDSPRHQERVEIDNNGKTLYSWIVYPETSEPAPVVLVIHENKWLTDRVRQMADDIAAEWYIAIAPDLLSSYSDEYTRTTDFATPDDATQALYALDQTQVTSDMQAVYDYAQTLPAANGKTVSAGFCRGWSQAFEYAIANPELEKSYVFYGTAPASWEVYADLQVPIVAFYAWDDERVNSTIPQTEEFMSQNNNTYEYEMYPWAGHAFMRNGVMPDASQPNIDARTKAFERLINDLKDL